MGDSGSTLELKLTQKDSTGANVEKTGFVVERVVVTERISELYHCDVWFCSTSALQAKDVIGNTATLTIRVASMETAFAGLLFTLEFVGRNRKGGEAMPTGYFLYRGTVSPKLRLLELDSVNAVYGSDTSLNVKDIIVKKFDATGIAYDITALAKQYPKSDFVVQFDENNLNFLKRQAEHHGIAFYFNGTANDEKVQFTEKNTDFAILNRGAIEASVSSTLSSASTSSILFAPASNMNTLNYPVFSDFGFRATAVSKSAVVAEYNPPTPLTASSQSNDAKVGDTTVGLSGKVVEYGSVLQETGGSPLNLVSTFSALRAEAIACRQTTFFGRTNCPKVRAGKRFDLLGYTGYDGEYLTVAVKHEICTPLSGSDGHPDMRPQPYQAQVECIPSSVVFRPPLVTPKPAAAGVFTAFVDSSTPGAEADIDGEGRYRLQFHYDQYVKNAGQRSGRVRRAQPYAGPGGTGMHFPLLKGSEVLVACVNGDIDRPVIMGAVPNRDNPNIVFTESDATKQAQQEMPSQTMNRIRTPSGSMLELNDRAAGTTASGAPQVRLAAPTDKTLQESGSYLRLGTYSSKESGLLTGLRTYTSTVTFTGKSEPVADLLSPEDYVKAILEEQTLSEIDAANEANEDKRKGGATFAEAATSNPGEAEAPATEAVDSTVTPPKVKDGYVLKAGTTDVYIRPGYTPVPVTGPNDPVGHYYRPGFSGDNMFEDKSVNPSVMLYVRRGFRVEGGQIVASKVGQRELLSISARMTEDSGYTPTTGGILLKTDKHLDVKVVGGTTALFGRGVTQQISTGDLKVTVPAGLVSINAANGIMLEAGTAAKPANINFLAYGYVKQEAKGPVSDYFYSTQERKVYGYSKEWFYGEKYSEFHGFEEKKFYGSSKSRTEGTTESYFVGSKTSTTFSSDTAFKMGVETKTNISQIFQLKIANEYSLNASAKAEFLIGAVFVLGASVKLEILLGAEMKITLWTFKIVSIDFKYVSGLDSKVSNVVVEHKSFQLANKPAEYKIGMSEGKLGAIQNYIAAKVAL
jgi:type VI secretion system secreted protein VgrG